MEIRRMKTLSVEQHRQAAAILCEAFAKLAPTSWPSMIEADQEVAECLDDQYIALAAVAGNHVVGWIGARPQYDGHVWELHPLAVAVAKQNEGIGRALVMALEDEVRQRGAETLFLGTDDEAGWTSAANTDLYNHVWERIRDLRNLAGHPFGFYQKLGFEVVGLLPDANGPGKPDIFMAKSVKQ